MSTIPETRTMDDFRRVNIPVTAIRGLDHPDAFDLTVRDRDIILSPVPSGSGRALTEKNRVRLPPEIAKHYDDNQEFAVIEHDDGIVLKPADEIDIQL